MPIPKGLVLALAAALVCLAAPGEAQLRNRTEPQYVGGYHPQACRYPPSAREVGLSGCCQMDLDIGPKGEVLGARGTCTDPVFLEPTRRCLTVQQFVPATRNGQPVRATHHLEYEWRSWAPSQGNLCQRLKTS
jgi:hypothetical protein